jgi:hypothetical protein
MGKDNEHLELFGFLDPKKLLEAGKGAVFIREKFQGRGVAPL